MVGVISVAESIHHKKGTAARAVIPVLAKAGITRALIPQVETWGYRVLNIFAGSSAFIIKCKRMQGLLP
jgi:hypothetical protein